MNLYNMALFLHVSGDIGIFIGIGVWLFALVALRRTTRVAQVRTIAGLIPMSRPLSIISGLLTLATGVYMALTAWDGQAGWAYVALGGLVVLLPPLVGVVIEPRMEAIRRLAEGAPDGPLSEELERRIHDRGLGTAVQTMATFVLGIVFLMTTKPPVTGSIVVIGVAVAIGVASGLLLERRAGDSRQRAGSAAAEE